MEKIEQILYPEATNPFSTVLAAYFQDGLYNLI